MDNDFSVNNPAKIFHTATTYAAQMYNAQPLDIEWPVLFKIQGMPGW